MKRQLDHWSALVLAATILAPAAAGASTVSPSPLALESVDPASTALAGTQFARPPGDEAVYRPRGTTSEIRYRPRRRYYPPEDRRPYRSRSRGPESFTQVHLGFMDPEGPERAGFLAGVRVGLAPDPHVQLGGQIDWKHRENSESQVISEAPGPGGTTITTRRDLERSSSDFLPLMGFMQIGGASDLPVVPYVGAGAGYQIFHLSAEDFATGEEFKGTFGGFGWQLWGGVGIPLAGNARFNTEVFMNQAELSRDVDDPLTGEELRETVDLDGTGMRFGISWGF